MPERRSINLVSLPGIESGRVGETSAADRSFSFVRFLRGGKPISKWSSTSRQFYRRRLINFRYLKPPKQVVTTTSRAICSPRTGGGVSMARKVGQIIRRGTRTWLVGVYSGRDVETKKRTYLNQTVHGGLRDAQAYLNKMLGERDRGRKLDSSKQTLNHYLDQWLELCAKPRLRTKSLKDYEGLLRRYVRPGLGPKALASISALDIQTLYRDLLARNLSARSIRYTHAVLRSALKQAMRWNLILANPADSVDLPRQGRRQIGVLTVEQARTFVKAISDHPYWAVFALALTTGMRPSEYLGLTWNDLDLDRGTVSVSHALEWQKGGWQFAETKRSRSRRVVKLQAWVVALLREQVPKEQEARGNVLLFRTRRGGPIRESRFVQDHFKPLLRAAGLPAIRLYDLRHTAATISLIAGVSPKVISEQLGHASVAFTLDVYSHVLPHMQDEAAEKVQALLLNPTPQ
jgi:integrase